MIMVAQTAQSPRRQTEMGNSPHVADLAGRNSLTERQQR